MRITRLLTPLLILPLSLGGWTWLTLEHAQPAMPDDDELAQQPPLGLEKLPESKSNSLTPAKVELGKQLFFDKRLSANDSQSCATCHDPAKGWSNAEPNAEGVEGERGNRNVPSIINAAYHMFFFWDGRAGSLEEQALGPIANPIEMNLPVDKAVEKIGEIDGYQKQFEEVFGEPVNGENLAAAIAAFERTVLSGNAPYDRYKAGDEDALSDKAKQGMELFFGKANCSACHIGPNFTDRAFHNVGVGFDQEEIDEGRFAISGLGGDRGAFKTPSLREVAQTGPYMHDGSLETLEEVIDYYDKGGNPNPQLDEEIFEMNLDDEQKEALVAFLREGLSSDSYPMVEPPELPE